MGMIRVNGIEIDASKIREVGLTENGRQYFFIGYNDEKGNPAQLRANFTTELYLQIRKNKLSISTI